MQDLRLRLPLLMTTSRRVRPETSETWWQEYGPCVRWMTVLYTLTIFLPMAIIFVVNPDEAWEKLQQLAIAVGLYAMLIGGPIVYLRRRDGY